MHLLLLRMAIIKFVAAKTLWRCLNTKSSPASKFHIQGDGSHVGLGDVLPAGSGSVNEVVDGWLQRLADRLQGN